MLTLQRGQGLGNRYVRIEVAGAKETEGFLIYFDHECTSELERNLLYRHLKDRLDAHMRAIREVSYNAGWRDAKAKRGKRTLWATATSVTPFNERR